MDWYYAQEGSNWLVEISPPRNPRTLHFNRFTWNSYKINSWDLWCPLPNIPSLGDKEFREFFKSYLEHIAQTGYYMTPNYKDKIFRPGHYLRINPWTALEFPTPSSPWESPNCMRRRGELILLSSCRSSDPILLNAKDLRGMCVVK